MSSQDTSSSPLPSPVSANPPSPFSQHSPSPSPIRPLPPCLPRVRPDLGREPFRPMGGTYSYPSYRHYNDPWGSDYPGESTPSALAASPKKKPPRKRKLEKKTALPTRKSYLKRFLADPNAAVIPSTWSPPQDNRAYEVPSETYELPSGNFVSSDPQHNVSQDGYIVPTGGSYDVHSTTYATNISYEVNNVYIDVAATSDYPQNTNVEIPSQFTNLESATCYGKEILSQYKSAPSSHVLDTSSTEPCFVTDNQIYVIDQSTQPASYVTDESTWDTSQVLTDSRVVDTPQWQASQLTTQLTNKNAEESNHVTQVQESNSTQEMCVFSFLTPDCDEILVSYPKLYVQTDSTQSQQSCDTQDPLSYATHDSAAHAQWISPDDSAQGLLYAQELIPTADSMQTYYVESEARATLEGEKMASYLVDYERYFPAQHGNADQSTHLDEYAHNNLGNADQPAGGDQGYSSQEVQESPPLSGQMYQPCETPVQIVDPNIALSYSLVSTDKPNCFTIQVNPASNPGPLATPEPPTLSNAPDMPALCITTPGGEYAEQELNSTPGNPGIRLMNQELKSTTAPDVDSREQELELSTMLAGD
ncbi:uncharacterized protein LOC113468595 [Diaphorina citri]|uniref:Uncharacterized protein LOC113468595 n=1 Tax=Diaphorina citri TaxID=121845 RepID=A0A3Q0J3A4_DIACI|nr:uncharacterized protein LOC113468595 [Diaphorina citri]